MERDSRPGWAGLLLAAFSLGAPTLGAATLTVTNTNNSSDGSLRQAIVDANGTISSDVIAFNIPGAGVHTIVLASALPAIIHPLTIDGYTQLGSSPNTHPTGQGLDTVLTIEIDGTGAGLTPCLTVNALSTVIQGLVINRCEGTAIQVGAGGDGAFIIGNFIGTDPVGAFRPGVQNMGIDTTAPGLVVGGATPFARNLISGNNQAGLRIENGANSSVVSGNLIGTNAAGAAAIEASNGVICVGATTTIGGTPVGVRNVISGTASGIQSTGCTATIEGNAIGTDVTRTQRLGNLLGILILPGEGTVTIRRNVIAANTFGILGSGSDAIAIIQGNFIGTDETGTLDLGNLQIGIQSNSKGWTIGGVSPVEGNVIAHNGTSTDPSSGGGVVVIGHNVSIRGNRIFDNTPLGIDLGYDGVTLNDVGDADAGPNNDQNYPMITNVAPGFSTTHIEGRLSSTASTAFDIDLFSDSSCQPRPQNYLQGGTYLGSFQVTTDGSGNASFATDVAFVLQAGVPVTATATDPGGNTSEFAQRFLLALDPPAGPSGGGVASTLTGILFEPGAIVTVGGLAATNVNVMSPTSITATMPARPAGTVNDVTVLNPSGMTGTLRNGWIANFHDVPGGQQFHDFVVNVVANGISAGVGNGNYGVDQGILREQMAVFLLKAKHGVCYAPPHCTGIFPDVQCPGTFTDWVEALFHEGITAGCGNGDYCPGQTVPRDQMAVFLLKAEHGSDYVPPLCTPDVFLDVPCPSPFADWIEQLSEEGITAGCGSGKYCPDHPNTRGEMAVFISKTFGLP